jgi:hypothetical protein
MTPQPITPEQLDDASVVMVVVGSHLRAETADRPLAYHVQKYITDWVAQHRDALNVNIQAIVCSDIWYLNHKTLQQRPTISVGGPGVNALSAYFAQALPEKTGSEAQVLIQIDPEFTDLRVCIWGSNHEFTVKGIHLFSKQYLGDYLRAVANQVEPSTD